MHFKWKILHIFIWFYSRFFQLNIIRFAVSTSTSYMKARRKLLQPIRSDTHFNILFELEQKRLTMFFL